MEFGIFEYCSDELKNQGEVKNQEVLDKHDEVLAKNVEMVAEFQANGKSVAYEVLCREYAVLLRDKTKLLGDGRQLQMTGLVELTTLEGVPSKVKKHAAEVLAMRGGAG